MHPQEAAKGSEGSKADDKIKGPGHGPTSDDHLAHMRADAGVFAPISKEHAQVNAEIFAPFDIDKDQAGTSPSSRPLSREQQAAEVNKYKRALIDTNEYVVRAGKLEHLGEGQRGSNEEIVAAQDRITGLLNRASKHLKDGKDPTDGMNEKDSRETGLLLGKGLDLYWKEGTKPDTQLSAAERAERTASWAKENAKREELERSEKPGTLENTNWTEFLAGNTFLKERYKSNTQEAIQDLQKQINTLAPKPGDQLSFNTSLLERRLAMAYEKDGKPGQAIEHYQKAAQDDAPKGIPEALFKASNLIKVAQIQSSSLGKYADSVPAFREALNHFDQLDNSNVHLSSEDRRDIASYNEQYIDALKHGSGNQQEIARVEQRIKDLHRHATLQGEGEQRDDVREVPVGAVGQFIHDIFTERYHEAITRTVRTPWDGKHSYFGSPQRFSPEERKELTGITRNRSY